MVTKLGISLYAACIISYLKYKGKVVVKEILYAYDCMKCIEKIGDELPIFIEKISHEYETSIKRKNNECWLREYIHYSPMIAYGTEGLDLLKTLSYLEKANLIETNLSDSIDDILKKGGRWEFPSNILHSEITITNQWDLNQKIFDISLINILENSHMINPIKIEPNWHLNKKLKTDIFVIMPFDEKLKPVFDDHIKEVCKTLQLSVKRADDISAPNIIIDDIWSLVFNSKIIICDCTGKNPNVFYELGMAHTIGKKVIIITQNQKDIPFDINHIRYIKYDYTPPGMSKFETELKNSITELLKDEMFQFKKDTVPKFS